MTAARLLNAQPVVAPADAEPAQQPVAPVAAEPSAAQLWRQRIQAELNAPHPNADDYESVTQQNIRRVGC